MLTDKVKLAKRKYFTPIISANWNSSGYLATWLATSRANHILQGCVLFLVTIVALPLSYQNLRAVTSPLNEVINNRSQGGDFIAFYAAGRLYSNNHDATPYDLDALKEMEFQINPVLRSDQLWAEARLNPYRNPPFYLPIVGYLATFPLPVAFAITTVLQALLLGALIAITATLASERALPLAAVTWGVLSLAYYHVWVGFNYAQLPAYIVALGFTSGLLLFRSGRAGWAGFVFALLWVKLQYIPPIVLFFIIRREWVALRGLILGSSILLTLSFLFVGTNGLVLYLETMIHLATAPKSEYFVNYEWMFNWRGLLERAISSPTGVLLLQIILTAVTYVLSIWAWTAPSHGSSRRRDVRLLVLTLTMVLAGPHVHGQDMMLLLPAGALVAHYAWNKDLPWLGTAVTSLGLLLFFWAVPQQVLITPTMNFSVLLLAFAFLGAVFMVRGDRNSHTIERSMVTRQHNYPKI